MERAVAEPEEGSRMNTSLLAVMTIIFSVLLRGGGVKQGSALVGAAAV